MQLKVEFKIIRGKQDTGKGIVDIDMCDANCTELVNRIGKFIAMANPCFFTDSHDKLAVVESSYGTPDGYVIVHDSDNLKCFIDAWTRDVYATLHEDIDEPHRTGTINGVTIDVIMTFVEQSNSFVIDLADPDGDTDTPRYSISIVTPGTTTPFEEKESEEE